MESLDSLTRVLGHCAIYESLYGQQGLDGSPSLNDSLVALYVLVLGYLCYLNRYLGHNDDGNNSIPIEGLSLIDLSVRSFKSITSGLKTRWEALLSQEVTVDKEAAVTHQEATGKLLYGMYTTIPPAACTK